MMPKRKSVIQQVIVLAVLAVLCSWPAVSGSLTGSAEKLINERLQTESLFKTAESTPPTLTASKLGSSVAPPMPYEDYGACPFECCTYRRWIATKDTAIQSDRNGNSPIFFNVNRGEWVTALTGVVITTVPGKAKVLRPTTINGIPAQNGETVYLLTYQGEGVYEIWYKGKKWEPYPDMSTLEILERPESTWWVQTKNNKGQVGWSRESDNFDNRDACGGNVQEPPVPACTAPIANISSNLYNPDFNCRQHWEYYLYLQLSGSIFSAEMNLISLTEKRAIKVYEVVERITSIANAFHSVASSPKAELKIFNAVWESSGLALNLIPLDDVVGAEIARDIINLMRDSLSASVNYLVTGTASTPYAGMVQLANRFGALWNIQVKVLAEINAITLAQEYLLPYYRSGGDSAKVAAIYGLPNTTTTEDVIKSMAKKMGIGWLDYSLKKTIRWISSFKVAMSNAATVCMESVSSCR